MSAAVTPSGIGTECTNAQPEHWKSTCGPRVDDNAGSDVWRRIVRARFASGVSNAPTYVGIGADAVRRKRRGIGVDVVDLSASLS